jgi:PAS domain-containing protein
MQPRTSTSVEDRIGDHPEPDLQSLGWFRFNFGDDRWTWSPQVERMHGYHPGTTAPGTMLVLSHVHPDDERQVADGLHDIRRTGHAFSSYHRIVDACDRVHDVVMVGMEGFYLDATPAAAPTTDRSGFDRSANLVRDLAADQRRREARRRRVRDATRC